MASNKVDMSLDDIIKTSKTGSGRGRGRGGRFSRGNTRGGRITKRNSGSFGQSPRNMQGRWQHDLYQGGQNRRGGRGGMGGQQQSGIAKLHISNLEFGVTDNDVRELFKEFGELKRAAVHYDRSGRSLGTAEVLYTSRSSAMKALSQYNGVPLDGRPMNIQLVGGGGGGGGTGMQSRLGRGGGGYGRGMTRGGRGGGRRGGRRGGGRQPVNVTKEQLDAEMDDYNAKME